MVGTTDQPNSRGKGKMAQDGKVVMVDDDPEFLQVAREVLQSQGYTVACFEHPEAAIQEMKREEPQLLITDLMMDTLDSGFSLANKVKEDCCLSHVPVLIVTAIKRRGLNFDPRTAQELKAMYADGFIGKPVDPEVLVRTVRELAGR